MTSAAVAAVSFGAAMPASAQETLQVWFTKAFYPADPDLHTLRMSFAAPEVPQIAQAVERLCRAAAQSR
jgi:DNA-binding transcriptional MocR family regulator